MTREKRLAAIEAREMAATAGGWYDDGHVTGDGMVIMSEDTGMRVAHLPKSKNVTNQTADAAFIAASRADVPYLLGLVRRYEALLHQPLFCDYGVLPDGVVDEVNAALESTDDE